jgi:DNA gyrase subunit A
MGRQAGGVKAIDLADDDEAIGLINIPMAPDADGHPMTVNPEQALLTITQRGYGKRTPVDEYRVQPELGKPRSQSRGGKGRVDIETDARNGRSVAALHVGDKDGIVVMTKHGQIVRMGAAEIRQTSRGTKGVRVVSLNEGDEVMAASRVPAE